MSASAGEGKEKIIIASRGSLINTGYLALIRKYPVPAFALVSLVFGSVIQWGLNIPALANWIWLVTLAIGGVPVLWQTARGISKGNFASDIVASIAIIAALVLHDAFPGVVIVLMQTGGKALEDYAFGRASSSLDALLGRSPRIARRLSGDAIEDVAVEKVKIGDRLLVRPGDLVPVDGLVINGGALIDESSLTGEPNAKARAPGERVFSGTVSVGEAFEIRAEKTSKESQYAKIVELVRKAQHDKVPIQRLADRYAT